MALIDKETIRKEIEFAKSVYSNPKRVVHGVADAFRQDGRAAMYDDILKFLDTLPEQPKLKPMNIPSGGGAMGTTPPSYKLVVEPEQPVPTIMTNEMLMGEIKPKKKSNALFDKCVENCDPAVMKEVSDNVDKMLGRQPVDGLEEEMEKFFETMPVLEHENIFEDTFQNIARHFAEWGAEHLKR